MELLYDLCIICEPTLCNAHHIRHASMNMVRVHVKVLTYSQDIDLCIRHISMNDVWA